MRLWCVLAGCKGREEDFWEQGRWLGLERWAQELGDT